MKPDLSRSSAPAYHAFKDVLEGLGWDDAGRDCWARKVTRPAIHITRAGWIPEKQVDAASSTLVARWVSPGTSRFGYQRLLEEAEQLQRACRAALALCAPATQQEPLFDAMDLAEAATRELAAQRPGAPKPRRGSTR